MNKPILQAGRPGDLIMILKAAKTSLESLREQNRETGEPTEDFDVFAIAASTKLALQMWMGEIPVAEVPTIFQH